MYSSALHPLQTAPPNLEPAPLGRLATRKVKLDNQHMLCPSIQPFASHLHTVEIHWMYGCLMGVGSKEWCCNMTNSCIINPGLVLNRRSRLKCLENSEAYLCKTCHLSACPRVTWNLSPQLLVLMINHHGHCAICVCAPSAVFASWALGIAVDVFAKMW